MPRSMNMLMLVPWVISILAALPADTLAATYSDGVLSDQASEFSINVPEQWTRQEMSNRDSKTHLFVSPDQNVAVAITTFPGAEGTSLQQLLGNFQQTAIAGAELLVMQQQDLGNLHGMLGVYRVQDPKGPVITGAFATPGNGNGYVLWHMIPEALYDARYPESDAVLNSFSLTSQAHQPHSHEPQQGTLPQHHTTPQATQSNSKTPQLPAVSPADTPAGYVAPASGYHWFTEETSQLRWHTPQNWPVQKVGANPTLLPPPGDILADAGGIKVQNLDRGVAKYADIHAAVNDMMTFIASQKGTLLDRKPVTVNGLNCHLTEFTVEIEGDSHHMWFLHVERQDVMTVIQYDTYGSVSAIGKLAAEMRPHVESALKSLRPI